ncbi:PHD-type domain-containing protein [Mycena kentingensis (nom. inval.)]|nr:PHD-type domain-containing protein [Mycena kentingensis (nom. inval.)]
MPPKRRRAEAFPEETQQEEQVEQDDPLEKENTIWQAFKDEHVEVLDLQSSVPRKYGLVTELEEQDTQHRNSLRTHLMEYIQMRRSTDPDNPPTNNREILALISRISDTSIRTIEEKLNQTRAASELVERSIRLVDHAIAEQEHLISVGAKPGTHLAPVLLPELVMPRWAKPARLSLSPELEEILVGTPANGPTLAPAKANKRGRKGRKKGQVAEEFTPGPRPEPPYIPNPDPNEKRYCYCDQVSFGEMIACDDARCKREWFHLACTSLKTAPEDNRKWYCDDCKLRKKKRKG